MLFKKPFFFVFLTTLIFLSLKWVLSIYFFDETLITSILNNTSDIQYYPLIVSLSELNLNPTFLENYSNNRIVNFPLASLAIHSFFFKFLGINSFILLEFLLYILLIFILFKVIEEIFNNKYIASVFCLAILFSIIFLKITNLYFDIQITQRIYELMIENFGTRTPRPLVTGVFYFSFLFYVLLLEKKINKELNYSFVAIVAIILGLLANSFFFLFIHCSLFLLIYTIILLNKKFIYWIKINFKKIIFFLFLLIFLLIPFIIQIQEGEKDYSARLGLIYLDLDKKIFLIKYYLINLFRLEFIILLLSSLYFNWLFNKKKNKTFYTKKINIFFILCYVSILTPILFFAFSPFVISIFHFLNIILFSFIFYILVSFTAILYNYFNNLKNKKNYFKFYYLFIVLFLFSSISLEVKLLKLDFEKRIELNKIHNFLNNNNLVNTEIKLFTNDLYIMNLWIFNKNSQLIISDAFMNSLKDHQIEFNLLNSLKDFGFSEENFKNLIAFEKSEIRNKLFMRLFNYKYQANSLYTLSDLKNYQKNSREMIINTSPFRTQLQIIPEDEKKRLLANFKKLKVDQNLTPDYVVINNSNLPSKFLIYNKKYTKLLSLKSYDIYKKNY